MPLRKKQKNKHQNFGWASIYTNQFQPVVNKYNFTQN